MQRLIYHQVGDPDKALVCEDFQLSNPTSEEVQVNWISSPITPADMATVRGIYGVRPELPATPGYDGCGVVTLVGQDQKKLKVQQRVLPLPRKHNPSRNGTWQTHQNYKASDLLVVPDYVTADTDSLSQFFNTYVTAYAMLMEVTKVNPGDWVIVTAAASSVGKAIIQLSKIFGFKVIAVVRRAEMKASLLDLGAAEVISTDVEDVLQKVKVITKLKGASIAIDAVGGEVGSLCMRALCDHGRMTIYGLLAQERYTALDAKHVLFNGIKVSGFWMPDWWNSIDADLRNSVAQNVFHWMNQGFLKGSVQEKFKLSDYVAATRASETAGVRAKIVFAP